MGEIADAGADEQRLAEEWKERLARSVGEQVQLSDDLMQMTTSPLATSDPADWTLAELLHHGCPPIPWLKGVAYFARGSLREGSLNPAIATVLYHAALASAHIRRGYRISRSSDAVLDIGLSECLTYPWLDRDTRRLLEEERRLVHWAAPTTADE